MRTLKLDFLHPVPRPHWSGWVILCLGLVMAAWVGRQGLAAQRALDRAIADAPKAAISAERGAVPNTAVEEGLAKEQLLAPWGNLFARLEVSRPKSIALLALEADARNSEATLTAEARNTKDMLAYIELLKGEAGFPAVTLASHSMQFEDPQQPLRFVLRVKWKN